MHKNRNRPSSRNDANAASASNCCKNKKKTLVVRMEHRVCFVRYLSDLQALRRRRPALDRQHRDSIQLLIRIKILKQSLCANDMKSKSAFISISASCTKRALRYTTGQTKPNERSINQNNLAKQNMSDVRRTNASEWRQTVAPTRRRRVRCQPMTMMMVMVMTWQQIRRRQVRLRRPSISETTPHVLARRRFDSSVVGTNNSERQKKRALE